MFNPHKSNQVVGATQCGFLLQWDTRAKTQPVQKTCLATNSHQYPVFCLNMVGPENANNIVSCSNDGWLCQWPSNQFNEPRRSNYLEIPELMRAE